MKKILLSMWFLLTVLLGLSPTVEAVEVGAEPPDLRLKELGGQEFRLSAHKGELLILKLGTTWCPTCMQQSGELLQLAAYLKENNIRVIEVFLQDSEEMVREFLKQEQFASPFNVMIDDGQALEGYSIYLIPRVILIGPDFKVLRDSNILTARQIRDEFEKVLANVH